MIEDFLPPLMTHPAFVDVAIRVQPDSVVWYNVSVKSRPPIFIAVEKIYLPPEFVAALRPYLAVRSS